MEAVRVLVSSLTVSELLKGLAIAFVYSRFLSPRSTTTADAGIRSPWDQAIKISGFFLLFLFGRSWLALVDHYVPEPYLDEVFHIPQAQTYCEGRFWDWDDKITTPPGLYLLSVAYHKFWMLSACTPFTLRNINLLAIIFTAFIAALCRDQIEAHTRTNTDQQGEQRRSVSLYAYHTAINIALFPILFFFSGLYYTDVVSTLLVLAAYQNHLGRIASKKSPSVLNDLKTVILGVGTLFMRQTNVFWVVVYMGGAEAIHAIRSLKPEQPSEERRPHNFATLEEQVRFYISRWAVGDFDDPPVDAAWPDDWLICLLSLAVGVLSNPVRVLRQIWSHITILGLFAGFVAWNGGVVLGDKSNHIATIHLAQMLYIWPLLSFFSAPLFLPTIFELLSSPVKALYTLIGGKQPPTIINNTTSQPESLPQKITTLLTVKKIYHPFYLLLTVLISLAIVKFNTIIHPFTLADNRHYMFYIFRYTIRRSLKIRYLLVVGYTASRWLVWRRLSGYNKSESSTSPSKQPKHKGEVVGTPIASTSPPQTSTVLLWLLTTSLSLITAPLVEPRYFILPWVFFRLLVPAWHWRPVSPSSSSSLPSQPPSPSSTGASTEKTNTSLISKITNLSSQIDPSLALETLWFIAINLGTMYIFLYKPFYWKTISEDGSEVLLDGGRIQRFMW